MGIPRDDNPKDQGSGSGPNPPPPHNSDSGPGHPDAGSCDDSATTSGHSAGPSVAANIGIHPLALIGGADGADLSVGAKIAALGTGGGGSHDSLLSDAGLGTQIALSADLPGHIGSIADTGALGSDAPCGAPLDLPTVDLCHVIPHV
jgi:hypothetical protein